MINPELVLNLDLALLAPGIAVSRRYIRQGCKRRGACFIVFGRDFAGADLGPTWVQCFFDSGPAEAAISAPGSLGNAVECPEPLVRLRSRQRPKNQMQACCQPCVLACW